MKLFLTTALAIGLFSLPVLAQNDGNLEKKLLLAKQYSSTVPLAEEVEKSIDELSVQVPVDKRELLKSTMKRNIKIDQLQSVSEMALADVFTLKELEALVAFYSTDEGRAIKKKMPEYQSRLEPVLLQMIRDGVESYDAQIR